MIVWILRVQLVVQLSQLYTRDDSLPASRLSLLAFNLLDLRSEYWFSPPTPHLRSSREV